jgi:two-component system sensor histidine kinase/response regulator
MNQSDCDLSTATSQLPDAKVAPARTSLSSAGRYAGAEAREVLVVDDSSVLRMMLAHYVEQLGHRITTASNGREAMSLLRTRRFDLVLLDVVMPELDGYGVLEQIKSDEQLREIPVIMISGLDEMESAVRCIESGAEDYLPKPFNPILLRARIGACLEKKCLWDELNENYHRLQEFEKLRDSLMHMIVHDLRTPLTSFLTGLYTLDQLGEMNRDQTELLGISISGGQMLLGMINDLLDISKMENDTLQIERAAFDPTQLITRAVQQVSALAQAKGLELRTEAAENLTALYADEDKLLRALVNLLGNAIKFTPGGGTITIEARSSEDGVLLSVRDTGEGIPEEAFELIFQKFGQVENRKAGHTMSTGLGLTFCKMVVEAHSGEIWVESTLGQGSTFTFSTPRA